RETGSARLLDAVSAYEDALKERLRQRVPLYWAGTQNNLGNALWALGERETGTQRLEKAVAAYQAALQEHTRDHVPREWAMTKGNLGGVLRVLSERRAEPPCDALASHLDALEVFGEADHSLPAERARNGVRSDVAGSPPPTPDTCPKISS